MCCMCNGMMCCCHNMGMMGMCDMAITVEGARFGMPEVKVGIFPMQIMAVLQRLIPNRKLYEMALTGEPITAAEALDLGLVNYVVPAAELDTTLAWLIAGLTTSPSQVALVPAIALLPTVLLSLPAGALGDSVDRRRFLIVLQLLLAAT